MKRYIMIGAPVTAVRTPPLLRTHLAGRGVAAEVETRHVGAEELDGFMRGVAADPAVDGLLVTMPHKKTVIPYLDAVSPVARAAGSVNAVKRLPSGGLAGAQFDGVAVVRALAAAGADLGTAGVCLVGLGGAGLAIARAIAASGCRRLSVADRDARRRDLLAAELRAAGAPVDAVPLRPDDRFDILVNATPLGMRPGDPSPFPPEAVGRARFVADIVADPPRTRLWETALDLGIPVVTGRDVVRGQIEPIADWLLAAAVEQ